MNKNNEEVWKGLIYNGVDYSDRFEISNFGMLRNSKTKRVYKTCMNRQGYYQVNVSLGASTDKKVLKLHRCVACTFLENLKKLPVINHKDGNKLNNYAGNLEWVTAAEDTRHAYDSNLVDLNKRCGVNNPCSKFTENDVVYIRQNYIPRHKEFGARALARKFNVHHSVICHIVNNQSYQNVA